MKLLLPLLQTLARSAMLFGYAQARLQAAVERLHRQLFPYHNWREVTFGDIWLLIPPGWGGVERDPMGGFVIHNRPRRFRIEGDAVWYGSAIELRISQPDVKEIEPLTPMAGPVRKIDTPRGPMVLKLAIANGVGKDSRRAALRVLKKARVLPRMRPNARESNP